jgi:hypothetical protein
MRINATTTSGRRLDATHGRCLTVASLRCLTAGLCAGTAVALLSGCAGGSSITREQVVTVTRTPTVTVRVTPPATTVATTRAGTARSDVVGRKFDLGTIVRVENDGGVPVIILDRWTAQGVSDSTLAARGVPIRVHSDAPYQNHNSKVTYRVPVAQGAIFTYSHCVAIDQPPTQKASTLNDFARLQNPETVVLLTINPQGQAYKAQNDPAC